MTDNMFSGLGWKWYGYPGHFIASGYCNFHLSTAVGGYLISTVGDYRPNYPHGPEQIEQIGVDRFYETMVFQFLGDDKYGDPIRGEQVDMRGYTTSIDAERGHYDVCWEYVAYG